MIIIQAKENTDLIRADVFLTKHLLDISRAQIAAGIKKGLITVNNAVFKPSYLVQKNDIFNINLDKKTDIYLEAQDINLDIIYDDEHVAVINKPQGLLVHPGAGQKDNTLINALLWHFPELKEQNSMRPGLVHRLDKDTSGLILIAKTKKCLEILSSDFKNRRVNKIYQAFIWGEPQYDTYEIISGHVRHPFNRLKFFTNLEAPKACNSNVRLAHSSVKVISRNYGLSKIEVTIHTGRTHQIRAHLADRGYPLLGDEIYGGKKVASKIIPQDLAQNIDSLNGQALHAAFLEFEHPISKNKLKFQAPLPIFLEKVNKFFI